MSPDQLTTILKMQTEMLRKNPAALRKMPGMVGQDAATLQQRLDQIAQMPPEQLKSFMGMAQKCCAVGKPAINTYQAVDRASLGNGKWICGALAALAVMAIIWCTWAVLRWILGWALGGSSGALEMIRYFLQRELTLPATPKAPHDCSQYARCLGRMELQRFCEQMFCLSIQRSSKPRGIRPP